MSNITMYGIKNCDTIKKAQNWLKQQDIEFNFHDYRKDGIEKDWLTAACKQLGWESVLNKRGTTYRQLSDEVKSNLNEEVAIEQMLLAPAMIKRPILSVNDELILGFKADQYQARFEK